MSRTGDTGSGSDESQKQALPLRAMRWWEAPQDPFTEQRTQIARRVELFALVCVVCLSALLPFRSDLTWVDYALYPSIAALLVAMLLLRPRRPGLAGFLASAGFITLVTVAAWYRQGLGSGVTSGAIALAVVVTGLLWGPKKTYVVAVFGSAAAASLAWWCPIPAAAPLRSWSEITAILLTLALFVELSLSALARRTAEVEQAARERQSLEAELARSRSLEALGRLSGGIAHDFNNLLTVILGTTDVVLQDERIPEEGRKALLGVLDAAERATELTGQLLAFGRRQLLDPVVFSPNQSLERLGPLLTRLVPSNIELVLQRAPELSSIRMDPARLEQVLVNLITNAADAMPGGGRIVVRTADTQVDLGEEGWHWPAHPASPGEYVAISVEDSGSGMTRELLTHIFEPFFTTKRAGKGTGLGLSTVVGIIDQSDGFIRVRSEPARGTEFQLLFPVAHGAPAIDLPEAPRPSLLPPAGEVRELEVLLVEDNADVRRALTIMLTAMGHTVSAVRDGPEALELLVARPTFALLITDVVMPKMSGLELLDRTRRLFPDLAVLLMTGYSEDVLQRDARTIDRAGTIAKPFTTAELEAKVAALLRRV